MLGIVGVVTFVPGSIFKGLSYLNEDVRKRHEVVKNSFSEGNPYEIRCKSVEAQSEEELCKKLAELKPRVSLIGNWIEIKSNHDLNLEKECVLYGKKTTPKRMLFLHKLTPEGKFIDLPNRSLDLFSRASVYKGNFTTHFDSQEIDISDI